MKGSIDQQQKKKTLQPSTNRVYFYTRYLCFIFSFIGYLISFFETQRILNDLIIHLRYFRYNLDDPRQNLAAWIIFKYKIRLHIQLHQRKAWYVQELSTLRKRIPELREALKVCNF